MKYNHFLDIKGMCCSAPVIYLTREFKSINSGEIALVESNKTSMLNDIPSYCRTTKKELLQQEEKNGLFYFWIKK